MENHQIITGQIGDIRALIMRESFVLPEDRTVLEAFKILANYTIRHFQLPKSHYSYIHDQFEIAHQPSSEQTMNVLNYKLDCITDHFGIEIPLRGVEAFFSWGKPNISFEQLSDLKFLIATLHSVVGKKVLE